MKSFLITACLLFCLAEIRADVSYLVAPAKESQSGRLETTTGMRGDGLVYRLTRIDRGNTGTYREYLEEFFVDGVLVLCLSGEANGDRMVDSRNLGEGVISLYYRGTNLWPEKILVGKDLPSAEVYALEKDGFYRAPTDEQRKEFLKALPAMPAFEHNKKPSQVQMPAPASGASAAK